MKFQDMQEKFQPLLKIFDNYHQIILGITGFLFGSMLGLGLACFLVGPRVGQLPIFTNIITMPLGIALGLLPIFTPRMRFVLLTIGIIAINFVLPPISD